ncbi:putative baseplate assembly protein [Moorena sp. SIO3I6]|uniref:putative baseplate assembly protein n=1 Tax=Moorena sp. SIO3I6 TaxID=2607831 RepID=UPI0013FAB6D6|nr:putative baseplate assembly protein [Moorena sp. SIO3I6]NEP23519.1 putative baseplate assembly protein [Moorena sp. SIO3I6]
MARKAPQIDSRTAEIIAQDVQDLLAKYLTEYPTSAALKNKGVAQALVQIFARFGEIIISRLNQVPDKNFLAFLDLLGASRLAPQPARAPLTFFLATGTTVDALVPTGTQVAAPPTEGETESVIFETEQELVVTGAQLESLFVRNPSQDQYADYSSLTEISPTTTYLPIFRGNQEIEHVFYVGHKQLLSFPTINNLKLIIELDQVFADAAELEWQVWHETEDLQAWQTITPNSDSTNNFSQSGEGEINFEEINAIPLTQVHGVTNRWLRCRLVTPISSSENSAVGMVSKHQLPTISNLSLEVELNRTDLRLEAAVTNSLNQDINQSIFTFGEKPKFGDTFYLANAEAFSQSGAQITLNLNLAHPRDIGINLQTISDQLNTRFEPDKTISEHFNPRLQWEFWNGKSWQALFIATREGLLDPDSTPDNPIQLPDTFVDETRAFTNLLDDSDGNLNPKITFTLPEEADIQPQETTINGVTSFWIRVRIISGNYGQEARFDTDNNYHPQTFVPPVINSVSIDYEFTLTEPPEQIITDNDFLTRTIEDFPFAPFESLDLDKPTTYLGFSLPVERSFPNLPLSLFVSAAAFKYGENLIPISPTISKNAGLPGTTVTHRFWLTNTNSETVTFQLATVGMQRVPEWSVQVTSARLQLEAGEAKTIAINVTIPAQAALGSSDRVFLQLVKSDQPNLVYSATMETFADTELPADETPQLVWQYWNGSQWRKITVQDNTDNLTRSGTIIVLPPADITPKQEFSLSPRYWLRVQHASGNYTFEPRLGQVLLNTTMAAQRVTIRNEILGSSDGSKKQTFTTNRTPILEGQQLEVRELELPSGMEEEKIKQQEGEDAINITYDSTGRAQEIWVRWHQVADFYESSPRDRHYVLDRLTGTIQFGDGINGLIPAIGRGNLRLKQYQTGGGSQGNQDAGKIVQLKTTIPYVDRVINPAAATGGADAESLDSLRDRIPKEIRHRHRAVTQDDYQDLAKALPGVVRAKCVPLVDLAQLLAPTNNQPQCFPLTDIDNNSAVAPAKVPGVVSVIIVPHSKEAKPLPSQELINRVQTYLETNAQPTVRISVVGAAYVSVNITTTIAVTSLETASQVEQGIEQALERFLHPLTGGFDRKGWDFGREPYLSDLYRLLESIPGVDHVVSLTGEKCEDIGGARVTGNFLVYSGNHTINLVYSQGSRE